MGNVIDLIGKKYNRLTVVERASNDKWGKARWKCLCECGNYTVVTKFDLEHGKSKSCGCYKADVKREHTDMFIGSRFGRLVVVGRSGINQGDKVLWKCQCDCGNTTMATKTNLVSGSIKSCGCYNRELTINRNTKHNYCTVKHAHPLYHIWSGMVRRCTNPKCSMYYRYGGRGISVCDEWRNNPAAFIEWGIANGYKKGLAIDRIDNDGNYEPSNCQFLTHADNNSKAQRYHIVVNGEDHSLREWDEILKQRKGHCSYRYQRYGMEALIEYIKAKIKELEER